MKGVSHPTNDVSLNPSSSPSIRDVIGQVDASRRQFIHGSVSAAALASAGGLTLGGLVGTVQAAPVPPSLGFPGMGFESIPASIDIDPSAVSAVADLVKVPTGYTANVFVAWGDPIMPGGAPFSGTASETAADQLKQFGMHNDGMHFFPIGEDDDDHDDRRRGGKHDKDDRDDDRGASKRGILCVNNEYTHEEVLFPDGQVGAGYTIAKTRKSQAAHGVSIVEARRKGGKWTVAKNSKLGRRITSNTFMQVSGPAAGHALMKTREFLITDTASTPTGNTTNGRVANGTVNNCAHGYTPWGTYLTCEENWNGNFGGTGAVDTSAATEIGKLNRRYGVTAGGFGYRWHTTDPRWDVSTNPNEPHLFGWVVEIDPYDPKSIPVKRTALGRFKHESVQYVVDKDDDIAFYMGDDERNEYIYKFVSKRKFNSNSRSHNRRLYLSQIPAWSYFTRPRHSAFHDLRLNKECPLPHSFKSLLGLGLKFCPNPKHATNPQTLRHTLDRHQRDLWLKHFFKNNPTIQPSINTGTTTQPPTLTGSTQPPTNTAATQYRLIN